jgi:hypothetical protein
MKHNAQPSSRCPLPTCWALTVTLEKVDMGGCKTTTTRRQMLGSRFCESEDEAVGSFLRQCLTENQGFKAGQVLALRINWPNMRPDEQG